MKNLGIILICLLTAAPVFAQNQIINYVGGNGRGGDGDYGVLAKAPGGQATLGALGVGDRYANLNLGSRISGVDRFWHISKRLANAGHALQFYYFNGTAFSPKMTFETGGDVGIGITNPSAKLHISKNGSNGSGGTSQYGILTQATGGQATLGAEGIGDIYANLNLGSNISGVRRFWHISKRLANAGHALQFYYYNGTGFSAKMTFRTNGNVGIGTAAPRNKLDVNGTVRAREVRVEASPWPDYVFEDDYKLPNLKEVKAFINENKHLPEIPSAKEVAADGVALGEMNAALLKKVEELTLYLIQFEEKFETLTQENETLKEQVTALENKLP